jgi:hypothetical protein
MLSMLSPSTMEHLELILGSALIAAALVLTVLAVVGTLTYLLTREPAHRGPAGPKVVTAVPAAAREREAAEVPTAVAG